MKTTKSLQGSETGIGWGGVLRRRDVSLVIKEQHEGSLVLMDLFCIWTVNILVEILYCCFARCYH